MSRPFVSVITVNYNGKRFIGRSLQALTQQDYPRDRYEVIVVDNDSHDGSIEEVERDFPDVKVVRSPANVGFARGNNLGLEHARGDLIALLNNDAFAHPHWMNALVEGLESRPEAAVASSKILFLKRSIEIELASGTFWPADVMESTDTRELGVRVLGAALPPEVEGEVEYGEGFYPPEQSGGPTPFRWTDGRGLLRVKFGGEPSGLTVRVQVDGWRPPELPPVGVKVRANGVERLSQELPREPSVIEVSVPAEELSEVPRRVQNAGLVAFRDWYAGDRGFGEIDNGRFDRTEEVFGGCGAAMMIRRSAIEGKGLFDPSFFMYYEDVDLSLRVRSRGHACIYVPDAVVEHHHAGSSVEGSPFFTYNVERNRLAVMIKHAPALIVARGLKKYTAEALRSAAREIRRGVFRGNPGSAGGIARLRLKVLASLGAKTPRLLLERARIRSGRTASREEIDRWLQPRTGPGSRVRIGIYDLHLRTLGGGEKYVADLASILANDYDVEILAYRPPSKEIIQRRLNVDLENVRIVPLPGDRELDLRPISARYDLFINGTHDSELEAYSRRSILVCHFPKRRDSKSLGAIAAGFFGSSGVEYHTGFYDPELIDGVMTRWTNGCGVLKIRNAVGTGLVVDLRIIEFRSEGVDVRFALEGRAVPYSEVNVLPGGITQYKIVVEPGMVEPGRQYFYLSVVSSIWRPSAEAPADNRKLGVIVREVKLWRPGRGRVSFAGWRLGYLAGGLLDDVSRAFPHLSSYDVILTHSRYSGGWIEQYWGREPRLLYPVIEGLEPAEKKNSILSVGRFFEGHHNKKHLLMVLVFKALVDAGLTGWEFHLVGGTHEEEHHRRYLDRVRREARGYPIFIHTNIPHEELARHYGQARIFWHASGYDEDERKHPERFEHFGISTVEAMLAGAVPVVIGKAGQLETVNDGVDGFLWNDIPTLKARTLELIRDPEKLAEMSRQARTKAASFSRDEFRRQLDELVGGLLV